MAHGRAPDWQLLAISTVMSGIILVVAYLYFKRAEANQLMFGDPVSHRAAIADLLSI